MVEKINSGDLMVNLPPTITNSGSGGNTDIRLFNNHSVQDDNTALTSNQTFTPDKLSYKTFGKNNSVEASTFARDNVDKVVDAVRTFNNDFPNVNYEINYENFPNPEDYKDHKKEDAFNQWKDAVIKWNENCIQDLNEKRIAYDNNLAEKFKASVTKNTISLYEQFNITERDLFAAYIEVGGDRQLFNNKINEMFLEARNKATDTPSDTQEPQNNNPSDIKEPENNAPSDVQQPKKKTPPQKNNQNCETTKPEDKSLIESVVEEIVAKVPSGKEIEDSVRKILRNLGDKIKDFERDALYKHVEIELNKEEERKKWNQFPFGFAK